MNIDVYKQYFSASCTFNEVERRGVAVWLNVESEGGNVRYEVGVSFFPHVDEEDFAISYDACGSKELISTKGRRSKKRDEQCLAQIQAAANEIAASLNGTICWDKPLNEAQYG
jgi:hypothetical protein